MATPTFQNSSITFPIEIPNFIDDHHGKIRNLRRCRMIWVFEPVFHVLCPSSNRIRKSNRHIQVLIFKTKSTVQFVLPHQKGGVSIETFIHSYNYEAATNSIDDANVSVRRSEACA
jgi:hypothetical protein